MKVTMKRTKMPTHVMQRTASAITLPLAIGFVALAAGCPAATGTPDGGGGTVEAKFSSLYGDYLGTCKNCHSPNGPGRTSDIEKTLDFTSRATALTTLRGTASGLIGNFMACNGVPFLAATPGNSLLVAVLDQPTRQVIDLPGHADCDADSIPDETAKVSGSPPPSAEFIAALKTWITNGAMND
jgi:hypothetical protein